MKIEKYLRLRVHVPIVETEQALNGTQNSMLPNAFTNLISAMPIVAPRTHLQFAFASRNFEANHEFGFGN